MAYTVAGTTIRTPNNIEEMNDTLYTEIRTLSGAKNRDYFGSKKRVWAFDYVNTKPSDYTTLKTLYDSYLLTGTTVALISTEAAYLISSTLVHIDLAKRTFSVGGATYISDFTLILTEA